MRPCELDLLHVFHRTLQASAERSNRGKMERSRGGGTCTGIFSNRRSTTRSPGRIFPIGVAPPAKGPDDMAGSCGKAESRALLEEKRRSAFPVRRGGYVIRHWQGGFIMCEHSPARRTVRGRLRAGPWQGEKRERRKITARPNRVVIRGPRICRAGSASGSRS